MCQSSVYFLQLTCLRVNDEPANHSILRHKRVGLDGLNGLTDRGWSVLESL